MLERRGARVAFVTTAGFRDAPQIGYQDRPDLFDLFPAHPSVLHEAAVELDERLDAAGRVLRPLDDAELRAKLAPLRAAGIESLAVCLLHAYRNDAHEQQVERVARSLGFAHVALSSRLSPLPKFIFRADTTLADAYLTPVLSAYVAQLTAQLPAAELRFMTSAGALVPGDAFHGKDAILSGPAGGVIGAARVASRAGVGAIIGFDMGGTSTDVSRWDGDGAGFARRYEIEIGSGAGARPLRLLAPMLEVETVAAGGGSICWFDGQKPAVGPRSAGADPGPACYGRGGPLCVTDVNFFLGKIPRFPFALDRAAVEARLDALIAEIAAATGKTYGREELAEGFTLIANAITIEPVRRLSAARGDDVRARTLVPFGGAGGQHACALARELGIGRILCHPLAGALSALGIGRADITRFAEAAVGRPLSEFSAVEDDGLGAVFAPLEEGLRAAMRSEDLDPATLAAPQRALELRYAGQETRLTISEPSAAEGGGGRAESYRAAFERAHRKLYGFVFRDRPIEVYAARVELTSRRAETEPAPAAAMPAAHAPANAGWTQTYLHGQWRRTAIFDRETLQPGAQIAGPAIVLEGIATVVIEPGWQAEVLRTGELLLRDHAAAPVAGTAAGSSADADPVELELFHQRFASIAEQMGAALQRTALSTNVKERLDFSCAVFSADGKLVANAPHIPVHLGAMGECVRCLLEDVPDPQPGEVFITNDPFRGGSHLPDVTTVTPVFDPADGGALAFFTASRAHHAEIGGTAPGSMPPAARTLAEEGVLIRAFRHRPDDPASEERLRRVLLDAPHPTRAVADNLADLRAQVAANATGARLLHELAARHGAQVVRVYADALRRTTEKKMRAALGRLVAGERRFTDRLDDGSPIAVTITLAPAAQPPAPAAIFDFAGTGPVHPGNLNANRAIVASAVTYCLRCLLGEPIPLNAGLLDAVEIRVPPGSLLDPPADPDPGRCAAVAGGNVETSQRLVDVILGALGVVAASQGTMNNVLFGGADFGFYETLGGGAGAGPAAAGASATHTHMTNTRLTDPEVLESRYPVRLRRWEIRHGSGGAGAQRGGDGMVREIEFLAPLTVSLLTSRRTTQPYGSEGGAPGASGRNLLRRRGADGFETLASSARLDGRSRRRAADRNARRRRLGQRGYQTR